MSKGAPVYVFEVERSGQPPIQIYVRDPEHHIASPNLDPETYAAYAYKPASSPTAVPPVPPTTPTPSSTKPAGAKPKKKYKPVARRVKPVPGTTPEEYRILRHFPSDPLETLPPLPDSAPPFVPGARYTAERYADLNLNPTGFLWPEEERLAHEIVRLNEKALAWDETEKGRFREDYFPPIRIPTVEHVPWNVPVAPIGKGQLEEIAALIQEKIDSGAFEPSNSLYRSRWFTVTKKDGVSLRLVHDLQPLNAVVIRDAAVPPSVEDVAEGYAARGCFAGLDLFVAFDQRPLDNRSRDLTTFQTPKGAFRLTCIPMGYTNSVQIMQGDVAFILQHEIPHLTQPFIDDVAVKGPATRYELLGGGYELHAGNPGIRRFVWEHLQNVHRIIHRMGHAGGTFSGKKLEMCVPEIVIVGHRCTYQGREVVANKLQVILDWPVCASVSDVRAFLGTLGLFRIFIRNFSQLARPLVMLTRKNSVFQFGSEHLGAMDKLKSAAAVAPAIRPLDYSCDRPIILGVDSSKYAVGYFLAQEGVDGKRWYNRFGSITWNAREANYSQPKIELFGLFRALRNMRMHIVGAKRLHVEVDAKFIKGMLSNPDVQPNATINRWIAGILLFDFKLIHVPGTQHTVADGLSRRPAAPTDSPDDSDFEEWIDITNHFAVFCIRPRPEPPLRFQSLAYRTRSKAKAAAAARDPPPQQDAPSDEGSGAGDEPGEDTDSDDSSIAEADDSAVTITLPTTDKSRSADDQLSLVERFLASPARPDGMAEERFKRFVKYASRFFLKGKRLWRRDPNGEHKVVVPPPHRASIIRQAHDDLGHKGVFTVRLRLLQRFWWPSLDADVRWFIRTCHECQVRNPRKFFIPPTVATPFPIFRKAYLDTFHMPPTSGFKMIVQARCSLIAWPEFRVLRSETGRILADFIFEQILCRWGGLEEIVTDNGKPFIKALEVLARWYGINHIRISPYNKQANGIAERSHRSVRDALVKVCADTGMLWPKAAHSIFWAERVTITKSTGMSPFFAAHGVEPLLPFDISEATYLVPEFDAPIETSDLLAVRAQQLMKRDDDLADIGTRVLAARYRSVEHFIADNRHSIRDYDFKPGDLVLVRNVSIETSHDSKTLPRYAGPLMVVQRYPRGSYQLAEVDGALSRLRFAAFRLIPYYSRTHISFPVDKLHLAPDLPADMMLGGADDASNGIDEDEDEPDGSDSDSGLASHPN